MGKEEVNPLKGVEVLLDRIILEKIPVKDEVRSTGFTVPAEARAKNVNLPRYGTIRAVGPGDPQKGAMKVKEGDVVCYQFFAGVPISVGDRQFMVMRECDIMFILKK